GELALDETHEERHGRHDESNVLRRDHHDDLGIVSLVEQLPRLYETLSRHDDATLDPSLRETPIDQRQAVAVGRDHAQRTVVTVPDEDARQVEPGLVGRDGEEGLVDHLAEGPGRDPYRGPLRDVGAERELGKVLRLEAHDLELGSSGEDIDPTG